MQEVYSKYMPYSPLEAGYSEEQCEKIADGIKNMGLLM